MFEENRFFKPEVLQEFDDYDVKFKKDQEDREIEEARIIEENHLQAIRDEELAEQQRQQDEADEADFQQKLGLEMEEMRVKREKKEQEIRELERQRLEEVERIQQIKNQEEASRQKKIQDLENIKKKQKLDQELAELNQFSAKLENIKNNGVEKRRNIFAGKNVTRTIHYPKNQDLQNPQKTLNGGPSEFVRKMINGRMTTCYIGNPNKKHNPLSELKNGKRINIFKKKLSSEEPIDKGAQAQNNPIGPKKNYFNKKIQINSFSDESLDSNEENNTNMIQNAVKLNYKEELEEIQRYKTNLRKDEQEIRRNKEALDQERANIEEEKKLIRSEKRKMQREKEEVEFFKQKIVV